MSAISTKQAKEEKLWQSVQEMLEEQKYPDVAAILQGNFPAVHSLKELVMSSVCMETSGEPLVTAWTAQPGSAQDIVIGYQSLLDFLHHDINPHKKELLQSLIYPLLVYCYLALIASNEEELAQQLYSSTSDIVVKYCSYVQELKELPLLTTPDTLLLSPLAEKYKSNKYFTRLSEPAFTMLMTFLQSHPTTAIMNIIQKHCSLEVYGSTSLVNGEQKVDGKKNSTFIKPNIDPIPELVLVPPRSLPSATPQPSSSNTDALAAKAEFQHKLTTAVQQLDSSIPSLLLCAVHSPCSIGVQCASLTNSSKVYACGFDDSSIHLSSWLPRTTDQETIYHTHSDHVDYVLRGHQGPVYGLDFCPSGQYLLSSSEDTTVRLWDITSRTCKVEYKGHFYPVWDVSFRLETRINIEGDIKFEGSFNLKERQPPDGYFVSSSFDHTARLWNTDRIYPLRLFAGHNDSVNVAQCHPNGNYVATGSKDHTCRLWDVNSGGCVRLFTGSKCPVTMVTFSPFGKHLASASYDGTITLWDLGSSRVIRELKGHSGHVTSMIYSCDGTLLASTGEDKTVKLWNIKSILAPSSSNNQGLISSQMTGSVLPLHVQFTHRNCLVAIGCHHSNSSNNNVIKTKPMYSKNRHNFDIF